MGNSTKIILKTSGLIDSPNNLSLPDGALEVAENVIIKREGVIEPRRGYKIVGSELLDNNFRIRTMFEYNDRLLRYYSDKLQYQSDDEFKFVDLDGSFKEASDRLRLKAIESNGNLYFTTDDGIKKLSAKSGDDLINSSVEGAGGIKALDFEAELVYEYGKQSGIVNQDGKVSYRILYNKRDRNNVLIQGAPSQTVTIENPMSKLLVQDFTKLLDSLDQINITNPSAPFEHYINNNNYVNSLVLPITTSGSELRTNIIQLAENLDKDILIANGTSTDAKYIIDEIDVVGNPSLDTSLEIKLTNTASVAFGDILSIGDKIQLENFVDESTIKLSQLNSKRYTITEITGNVLSFIIENNINNPFYTGTPLPHTIVTNPVMESATFRDIPEPFEFSTIETHGEMVSLQEYMVNIITTLQSLHIGILPRNDEYNTFIDILTYTTALDVKVTTQIPASLTLDHFIQIYRTFNFTTPNELNINDITPNEEFQLAYEEYIYQEDIDNSYIQVVDITGDSFLGAYLYTNDATGEGDVNSNFKPPFAVDINRFKNVTFFANTRTQHRMKLDLVGIEQIRNSGLTEMSISVTRGLDSVRYELIQGVKQEYTISTIDENLAPNDGTLDGDYFILESHKEKTIHVFYYSTTGAINEPDLSGMYPNHTINYSRIQISVNEIANDIAVKTADKINTIVDTFVVTNVVDEVITLNNIIEKELVVHAGGETGFTITKTVTGLGEDISNNRAIISSSTSTAIALDETSRSLMKIINLSDDSFINGYYLSRANDIPGKMYFEANDLNSEPFYITASSKVLGQSFNPSIDEQFNSNTISFANGRTNITTNVAHNLGDGNSIILTCTGNSVDSTYTISVIDNVTFSIAGEVTLNPNYDLSISAVNYAQTSENEDKKNRVYYSKFQQPESVPLANYFDIGNEDKHILRIYPLRDSLFVFKEDGLFRISGETAPFSVQLMDSSYVLIASDSISIVDNLIYGWTTKGIQALSESGGRVISGNIDNIIYKLGSNEFTHFNESTFSIGYESDNSVIFYTTQLRSDITATVGLRYSTKTSTWSTYTQSVTCGILNPADDKVYLGESGSAYMLQERKSFSKNDYADKEYTNVLFKNKVLPNNVLALTNFDMKLLNIGDVVEQTQTVTVYDYNMLLKKIDIDSSLLSDYHSSLESKVGDDLHIKVDLLASKLDADIGTTFNSLVSNKGGSITNIEIGNLATITSVGHGLINGRIIKIQNTNCNPVIDGDYPITVVDSDTFTINAPVYTAGNVGLFVTDNISFQDLKVIYNKLIVEMNSDGVINFNNYTTNTIDSSFEAIITHIDIIRKRITINSSIELQVGNMTFFQAIVSKFFYRPITMDDPMGLKHLRESTLMFEDNQFTSAKLGFATDLMPQIVEVPFDMNGNGIFGNQSFGTSLFGGISNNVPFRTYIPRDKQRCTYIQLEFKHNIAREKYALLSATVTGNISTSTRAYR